MPAAPLGALALTLIGAVLLVLDVAVGREFALLAAGMVAVVLVALWFGLAIPLVRRARAACDDPAVSRARHSSASQGRSPTYIA